MRIFIAISVQKAIGVNCAPFAGQVALAFEWYKKKRVGIIAIFNNTAERFHF